ncbi:MAG: Triosephosphate isomerase [Candidatus Woesebacteria bacterium GW2011_GWA1_37_7]|uniref:Triosephosphate isomerase n=1 Tax=Candidatus Woesebacteria bacterium GW2011_GWA1_37_7 TaxID=1618545 RepID=A0A0G0JM30_9BACT|nr:MAG: Triosephosphate isomerase [Candidatus Woesebacteria bacterium GW2011_GWA1_37_7]
MIFVNFKTYERGSGKSALELVSVLEDVAHESGVRIIPAVQASDIKEIVLATKLEVWTQHIDAVEFGAHTGSILAEAVFEDGATGTFLNHSEHRFDNFDDLKKAHERSKEVGLKTLIFAANLDELKHILELAPNYASYEPPELVGSKTTSVAKEKPEVISQAVTLARAKGIPLIVGAGIKSMEDVQKSVELGAAGIAVASSIVVSENPRQEIMELIEGFR